MKNNVSKNNLSTQDAENVSYIFPKSEEIVIPRSDLQIQLEKFRERIRSSFSMFDLLAILSLWAPIFSANFKPILIFQANEIKSGYIVLASIVTIIILWSRVIYFILSLFKKDKISDNPEKMANKILEQCQSKPKFK